MENSQCKSLGKFCIQSKWNGEDISKENFVYISINAVFMNSDLQEIEVNVEAPFHDDIVPPNTPVGKDLWNYEVVELFFLGKKNCYLELELSPHNKYLVLALSGPRNCLKRDIEISSYESRIDHEKKIWFGKAHIPANLFPQDCNKLNAYAIHGSEQGTKTTREYYALYHTRGESYEYPDFHRLHLFQPWIESEGNLPNRMSAFWEELMK